jgi:hypothetical protein
MAQTVYTGESYVIKTEFSGLNVIIERVADGKDVLLQGDDATQFLTEYDNCHGDDKLLQIVCSAYDEVMTERRSGVNSVLLVPTLGETIRCMKDEILSDVRAGKVPADVKSFSELHDYVDANEYGGFCKEAFSAALINHFGGRDENEGMPDGMMNYTNGAQNAINQWIKAGGISEQLKAIPSAMKM